MKHNNCGLELCDECNTKLNDEGSLSVNAMCKECRSKLVIAFPNPSTELLRVEREELDLCHQCANDPCVCCPMCHMTWCECVEDQE